MVCKNITELSMYLQYVMPVTLSPNDEGSDPPVSLFLRLVDDRVVCRYQVEFVVGADSWMMLGCFFVVSYGNRY